MQHTHKGASRDNATSRGKGALLLLARLDSRRLPGKQLKELSPGLSVMDLLIARMKRCQITNHMIMTTTDRKVDQPLVDYANSHGLDLFRGSAEDVAGRCLACMKAFDLDWFIRICADSPLMDPQVVDLVAEAFLASDSDLTSNVFVNHDFPFGCSVEIITKDAMQRICDSTTDLKYLEHVTAYAYTHAESFAIENIRAKERYSEDVQAISVDTPDDLEKSRWIVAQLDHPVEAPLSEIVPLAEKWQQEKSS